MALRGADLITLPRLIKHAEACPLKTAADVQALITRNMLKENAKLGGPSKVVAQVIKMTTPQHVAGVLHTINIFDQYQRIKQHYKNCILKGGGGGGGVQGNIFGRISFELWAPQVPLMIGETFGELDGPRGANGAPNCSSHHPDSSHIGFDRSRTNGMTVVAQNVPAQFRREWLK